MRREIVEAVAYGLESLGVHTTDGHCAEIARAVLRAALAGEPEGDYEVTEPFEGGPLTRVRHKVLRGHEWGFASHELALAVANALNLSRDLAAGGNDGE